MYQIIIKMKDGRKIKRGIKVFKIHNYFDAKNLVRIQLDEYEFVCVKEDIKNIKIKEDD